MKRQLAALLVLCGVLLLATATTASAKGEPQGPDVKDWFCILDLGTWHCVPQGVLANFGGPSGPSVNWECDDPNDALCGPANYGAVSLGPPPGTHFVGTENLIRADLYAGQPCPRGTSGFVDLGVAVYWYCHHYGSP
jgi:hypothetical protein